MTLKNALEGKSYIVQKIDTEDIELISFLFSLGFYSGESVRVISRLKSGLILNIKNVKYHIDNALADAVTV